MEKTIALRANPEKQSIFKRDDIVKTKTKRPKLNEFSEN